MKKLFFSALALAATFFATTNDANAQIALGVQGGVSVPVGDFTNVAGLGFGGNVNGSYFVTPQIAVGANISYHTFGSKETTTSTMGFFAKAETTSSILGVAPTIQYFFAEKGFRPYLGADLGYYSVGAKATTTSNIPGFPTTSASASSGYFGVAPHAGFLYDFSDNLALNMNVKYNAIFGDGATLSSIPVNVGVLYTLGK